jgi:hypothetical protein
MRCVGGWVDGWRACQLLLSSPRACWHTNFPAGPQGKLRITLQSPEALQGRALPGQGSCPSRLPSAPPRAHPPAGPPPRGRPSPPGPPLGSRSAPRIPETAGVPCTRAGGWLGAGEAVGGGWMRGLSGGQQTRYGVAAAVRASPQAATCRARSMLALASALPFRQHNSRPPAAALNPPPYPPPPTPPTRPPITTTHTHTRSPERLKDAHQPVGAQVGLACHQHALHKKRPGFRSS